LRSGPDRRTGRTGRQALAYQQRVLQRAAGATGGRAGFAASRFAERAFLCNSGAEANEAAIKLVRKWATGQGRAADRRVIVTFRGSFHGRTLAAVTATAQPKYQEGYEPLPGGFRYVDFNDIPSSTRRWPAATSPR
jgi:acetylornithine/succinyldiaminopimelate/putrescine aminotransferase